MGEITDAIAGRGLVAEFKRDVSGFGCRKRPGIERPAAMIADDNAPIEVEAAGAPSLRREFLMIFPCGLDRKVCRCLFHPMFSCSGQEV